LASNTNDRSSSNTSQAGSFLKKSEKQTRVSASRKEGLQHPPLKRHWTPPSAFAELNF